MNNLLHAISYLIVIRIIVQVMLGHNVRNEERLPSKGPAIIVLNHRSYWDSLLLLSLLPENSVSSLNTFSTTEYFSQKPLVAWFYQSIMGIEPLKPTSTPIANKATTNPLQPCLEALSNDKIVILFTDEHLSELEAPSQFRDNLSQLALAYPYTPIVPVELHGLGNELPKDRTLFTPSFCDLFIGQPVFGSSHEGDFNQQLNNSMGQLNEEVHKAGWE